MVSRENTDARLSKRSQVPKLARIPVEGILHNLRLARPVFVLDATTRHGMAATGACLALLVPGRGRRAA
eukprot:Skav232097  [mRNA]  locus=scaffold2353:93999:94680:+ [translate_table: standard]